MARYSKSEAWLSRAEKTIPLGSQTFSKSRTQYPVGISPLYIKKARGCYVWDLDNNKYIDLVSSLASITLGYADKEIEHAVKKQLRRGVSFSLPGALEAEVAELICEIVPSAEMVRFGKNGTDATSAAVRLARAYTGKDHVLVCGYHGWQDWYIGSTTRNKGVPDSVSGFTHSFSYNNLESLESLLNSGLDIACLVMEPMNSTYPNSGFLEKVRELTTRHQVILIFDETITGFRFSKGGAQEYFNVIPDLSTFGKGIANGFPLSAVVGKREIMMEMEQIFFSSTFGGELLSLSAAKVVLNRHIKDEVTKNLSVIGEKLSSQVQNITEQAGMSSVLKLSGHPTWRFLNWTAPEGTSTDEIKTFFLQEMFENGVIVLGSHNVSLAHEKKITKLIECYETVLSRMSENIFRGNIGQALRVKPLEPLFKIR